MTGKTKRKERNETVRMPRGFLGTYENVYTGAGVVLTAAGVGVKLAVVSGDREFKAIEVHI